MVRMLGRFGALAAVASGWIMVVALVVTVLFFVVEAPALIASGNVSTWTLLGRGSDALVGLSMLAAIPLAVLLHERWRDRAFGLSAVALAVGLAGMVGFGTLGFVSIGNLAPYPSLAPLGLSSTTAFGLWLLAINWGAADTAIHGRLRQLGIAVGMGWPLQAAAWLAGGGESWLSDPQAALNNPLAVVLLILGVLSVLVGYPIWVLWLGRHLSRT